MGVDYPVRSTERGSGDLEKDTGESDNEISQEQKHNSATKEAPLTVNSEQDVPWTLRRVVAIAALCTVYVGSQAILYFVSPSLSYIAADIGTTIPNWLLTANTLAVAAICPFVGYLTDLLGRRWIAIFGSICLVVSSIIVATTHSLGSAILGMTIGGIGAGICELTALAGVAEITPVRWRGVSLSIVTFTILPFIPVVLYVQLLYIHSTWRWGLCICAIWNFLGFLGLLLAYKPPARNNTTGLSAMDIAWRIDWVGAFLTIAGVTLFLVGLQAGGYQYPWVDAKVLAPLIIGLLMILAFPAWEYYGAKHPIVPAAIFKGQSVVALGFAAVFVAGMNFYAVLGFFPVMLNELYTPDPILVGVRALSYPFAILGGACVVSALLSYTRGHVRVMFTLVALMMTVFGGALAASTPFNPGFAVAMTTLSTFGIGAIIVPALTVVLYAAPDEYIGTVAALSLSVRFLGGSIGTTIYYNIFNTKITHNLPAYIAAAAAKAGLPKASLIPFVGAFATEGPSAAAKIPGVSSAVLNAAALATRWAFADSLKYVWYATIPFGMICVICCAFIPNISKFMSNRVAVDLH